MGFRSVHVISALIFLCTHSAFSADCDSCPALVAECNPNLLTWSFDDKTFNCVEPNPNFGGTIVSVNLTTTTTTTDCPLKPVYCTSATLFFANGSSQPFFGLYANSIGAGTPIISCDGNGRWRIGTSRFYFDQYHCATQVQL